MFESHEQIARQLPAGEDARAEFKEVVLGDRGVRSPDTEELAGEVVSFANAEGGVVFLGVNDRGEVCGLPEDRCGDVEGWIVNVSTDNCDPPIRPLLRKERLPRPDGTEGLVMLVEVRRGLYVHGTSGGRYLVRVGSSKRDFTVAELARLFQQRGRAYVFDEQTVPTASAEELDREALKNFYGEAVGIPWPDLLRNTRVTAADDAGVDRPTVAGLLAFGRDQRRHLPSAYIESAVYRGVDLTSDDLVHAQQIEGRLDEQIDDAVAHR
jgi:predicted HTH transcriptional regulator